MISRPIRFFVVAAIVALCMTSVVFPQTAPQASPAGDAGAAASFNGLEQWKSAVSSGDATALAALYSTTPKARIITQKGDIDAAADIKFWTDLKPHDVKAEVLQTTSSQPDTQQIVLAISLKSASHNDQTVYVNEGQLWQHQGGQWKLAAAKRTDITQLQQPTSTTADIYPDSVDAHAEIKEAISKAAHDHKRVILVFGANWCFDCHVLDKAFHRDDIAPLLNGNFEVVHVDIGKGDKNQDLMKQYDVPMSKGIPALAVLDTNGKLLFSQKDGQFESARSLGPADLIDFLNKWKPQAR
jgi:thioredoxin-related protein